ncbi:MAG TPA: hypothetical protein VJR23_15295 [Candidatus Acidoferrales bacterium]|nr:hypothetical protein [Candidatus Acidoferrales bacterium]
MKKLRLNFIFVAALGLASPLMGQQETPATALPSQPAQAADSAAAHPKSDQAQQATSQPALGVRQEGQNGEKDDRILYTLPNYLTIENESTAPSLTVGQKYKLVAKDTFDLVEYPYTGFVAAISQAQNSEPGYGQGWDGYGKRYGAAFADTAIASFMTSAVFPSMLKEDPRYYQMGRGNGGVFHRVGYAISRIFVTRTDSGGSQFNYSEIAGNAVAAGISNTYHPSSDRTVVNTLSVWGTQTMWDTVANEVKEFWPDMRQWISRKKARE